MGHNSYKQENLERVVKLFRDSNGQAILLKEVIADFGIARDQCQAIFRTLVGRKYILKIGTSNTKSGAFEGVYYVQNPDYPGMFVDAIRGQNPHKPENSTEKAGRAYVPPPNKEPWEPQYIRELLRHKKLCESTR